MGAAFSICGGAFSDEDALAPHRHRFSINGARRQLGHMLTFHPIGYVRSPYAETIHVPKGPGTQHQAEGILEIAAEFEQGLLDIEGFSHLFVIWVFHRNEDYELVGT